MWTSLVEKQSPGGSVLLPALGMEALTSLACTLGAICVTLSSVARVFGCPKNFEACSSWNTDLLNCPVGDMTDGLERAVLAYNRVLVVSKLSSVFYPGLLYNLSLLLAELTILIPWTPIANPVSELTVAYVPLTILHLLFRTSFSSP